jgi:pimeloyl-ACP methyl ester carboxylesterase
MWHSIPGIAAIVVLLLLFAGMAYRSIGERRDAKRRSAPGRLVSVGRRKLHLLCKGSIGPTIVIEQGAGELSRYWWPVQDEIAKFASVCTYDRAGYAWSEPAPRGRTIDDRAEELHSLLTNAAIPGPYVLVAHSYGGLIVRSFANKHPDEVAGLVLVDTAEEATILRRDVLDFYSKIRFVNIVVGLAARFGLLRLLKNWVPLDRFGFWLERPAEYAALCDDLASLKREPMPLRNSKAAGSLGALPVAVITHGKAFPGPFAILESTWSEGQSRLAALSTNSLLIVAKNSNHMIQIDEPSLVVDVVRQIHLAARNERLIVPHEADFIAGASK